MQSFEYYKKYSNTLVSLRSGSFISFIFFLLIMSETASKTEYFFITKGFIDNYLDNNELKTIKLNYHS